jgi:hypothetical protein
MASPFLCFCGLCPFNFVEGFAVQWLRRFYGSVDMCRTIVLNEIEVLQMYANLNACLH